MQHVSQTAEIIDFNAFKLKRNEQKKNSVFSNEIEQATPVYVWYPVWVLVPQNSLAPNVDNTIF